MLEILQIILFQNLQKQQLILDLMISIQAESLKNWLQKKY